MAKASPAAVGRLAGRLGIPAGELAGYGQREQTRTGHLREIVRYTGWRAIDEAGWKELDEFLFARAMEHDSPALLFRLACEYLLSKRVVRPGVVWLLEHVASTAPIPSTSTQNWPVSTPTATAPSAPPTGSTSHHVSHR